MSTERPDSERSCDATDYAAVRASACPDCGHHRGYHADDCPGPWLGGERDPGWAYETANGRPLAGPCTARRLGRRCRLIFGHEGGHDG
jgi:hypothetical protein